ncbi:acetyl-CoA carboxylase carboxyltransferase subunit alpha [Phenylobacterium sp.]|uniref:acetyl-CoA carboxylase carboxyltransferase subunit alpha n=1 Tax=Phenylobacterium sp. TaxID=1871053 RepID=UPI0025EFC591|nr:acetyl-CoA carboxylase carboxyltransferase subunit alpha [Phenylobacterium sp.]MCA6286396.1 acetyl-CoA carboxylase carboxyltransferase subunit alpha [Phenylobacterium sp.]MCA6310422.1 acetyl-CoA carboxylase carboxyltransferase subunit alpha [Phenylobacterium sp.]MCA6323365.1 acetyl-CoA carboxylase carboxyltransferase subunit alpha [Phenylobacterium sp.]MCA6337130.1 acetyl-CoA carboxylase carboxyltransferase subunit alpha [Phenylobacterium sp.]MCA6340488.1 acetyl-CoA carboxylase carboxyltran
MAVHYLEFERPIADLEAKIEELSRLAETAGTEDLTREIDALRDRARQMRKDAYANLDAWQKTQVARHPERPHFVDYCAGLIDEFVELKGDRKFADDQAIMGGIGRFRGRPVLVMGHEKGRDTVTRVKHNFGYARPEGYRKAIRLMELAERFNLPVISFVDTPAAYPGVGSEERGVAEAIARSTEKCLMLKAPMVAIVTGEGGSGGALGIACGNRVLILEHAIYSVIPPEGANSILWRGARTAEEAAKAMKITAADLLKMKIVDKIIPEPPGGAHADPAAALRIVGDALEKELDGLEGKSIDKLLKQRSERFYAIGRSGLK